VSSVFQPGSFYDNLDKAVQVLGVSQPGVVWALAQVSWDSIQDRDNFLDTLVSRDYFDVVNQNQGGN
jgi:hypothetical protein